MTPADPLLSTPSAPLLDHLRPQLRRWPPFSAMREEDVDAFLAQARQLYFEPGEVLVAPAHGVPSSVFLLRQGTVQRRHGAAGTGDALAFGPGELLPLAAVLGRRPVSATYTALDDVFVLAIAASDLEALARRSPPLAEFLHGRIQALLAQSQQALQLQLSSQALSQQAMETPLARLASGELVHCAPSTPLRDALQTMHERQVGSMLVADEGLRPLGILTRHDLLALVLSPGLDLSAPIEQVMTRPVHALADEHTAQDAALMMGEHGIRHVPVTREGRLVGMVSERDLFALQRASVQQVSARIHRARTLPELQAAADEIRALAGGLLAQGVQPRPLTELITRLNDLFTRRLLALEAARAHVALNRLCWLALGSEGRGEQTIATDQDNALVLPDDTDDAERERLRAWAHEVNLALDACGFPLCRGGVMAGEPACCLRLSQWQARFARWIDQGSPEDLLHASIYFDFRPLAGDESLATPLAQHIAARVRSTPRFLHQLAVNALAHRPPLDWTGRFEVDGEGFLDLKMQGTALIVDAARILALSQGLRATGTRERLVQGGEALGLRAQEYESWAGAFEFLQGLRLRAQLDPQAAASAHPNRLQPAALSDIDRRILAASLGQARSLQQRLQLDWAR